jgi:hypothetical protein
MLRPYIYERMLQLRPAARSSTAIAVVSAPAAPAAAPTPAPVPSVARSRPAAAVATTAGRTGGAPPTAPPAPAASTPFRNSAPTVTIVSAATPLGNGAPTITIVSAAPTAPLGLARRRRRTVAPVARVAAITPLATIARIATIAHVAATAPREARPAVAAATLHRIAFPYRRRLGAPPRDEGAFRSPEPRPDATISRIGAGAVLEVHLPAAAVGHAPAVDEQVV